MQAAVYRRYGAPETVVGIEEVADPVPGDDEVLIAVRAAAINPMDVHFIRGRPAVARLALGLLRPRRTRPGADVAGEVVAVGRNVSRFKPGDAVFGAARGALAEQACAPESGLAIKPAGLSFAQAAAIPVAGLTALQGLRDIGRIVPGQKVLINGASGGIGTFAVQIAKALGAEVTGVCSAANVELVRSIGADRAIDYGKEDFTRSGECWDLIFDLVQGRGLGACRRVLAPGGKVVAGGILAAGEPSLPWMARWGARVLLDKLRARFGGPGLSFFVAKLRADDLAELAALGEAGKVVPVIDKVYGLAEAAAAIGHVARGHARGKVVVVIQPEQGFTESPPAPPLSSRAPEGR